MASLAISCPECDKPMKAPEDLVGQKIKCKDCGHIFVLQAPKGAKAPAKAGVKPVGKSAAAKPAGKKPVAKKDDPFAEDGQAKPYSVNDMDFLPRCPYCANEMENEDAVICLHCGYNTVTRIRQEPKKTYETTGGEVFLWLLPGILCAIGVLICVAILVVFWLVFPKLEEDFNDVWWGSFFALWARIWGSVIVLFITFFLARFAIIRLIMNNSPPEVEKKK